MAAVSGTAAAEAEEEEAHSAAVSAEEATVAEWAKGVVITENVSKAVTEVALVVANEALKAAALAASKNTNKNTNTNSNTSELKIIKNEMKSDTDNEDNIPKEKEIIKITKDYQSEDDETVDEFFDDIVKMMENKGVNVNKDKSTYTLFDDAIDE